MIKSWLLALPLLLCACATGISVEKYDSHPLSKEGFMLCHGYSCTCKSPVAFDDAEWRKIREIFRKPPRDAREERGMIGKAIARMETITGAEAGTDKDMGEAVSLKQDSYQMDCIDETVNTTHYLRLLSAEKLLRFYEPWEPTHRGYFIDGRWPHNTAVMREMETGDLYVVDSFYRPNGQEPYIMPRQTWLDGWKPKGSKQ